MHNREMSHADKDDSSGVFRYNPVNHSTMVPKILRYASRHTKDLVSNSLVCATWHQWARQDADLAVICALLNERVSEQLLLSALSRKMEACPNADGEDLMPASATSGPPPSSSASSPSSSPFPLDELLYFLGKTSGISSVAATQMIRRRARIRENRARRRQAIFAVSAHSVLVTLIFLFTCVCLGLVANGGLDECCDDPAQLVNETCTAQSDEQTLPFMTASNRTCKGAATKTTTTTSKIAAVATVELDCSTSPVRALALALCSCALVASLFQWLLHCARCFSRKAGCCRQRAQAMSVFWWLLACAMWIASFGIGIAFLVQVPVADTDNRVIRSMSCVQSPIYDTRVLADNSTTNVLLGYHLKPVSASLTVTRHYAWVLIVILTALSGVFGFGDFFWCFWQMINGCLALSDRRIGRHSSGFGSSSSDISDAEDEHMPIPAMPSQIPTAGHARVMRAMRMTDANAV